METNIFRLLKLYQHEIRHSNFLVGLLDYKKDSKEILGSFLLDFLLQLKNYNFIDDDLYRLFHESKDIVIVESERNLKDYLPQFSGRLDILIYSKDKEVLICIENKIKSKEGFDQLNRYYEYINSDFLNYKKCFLYLTLLGEVPSNNNRRAFSYKAHILPLIDSFIVKEENIRLKLYLEDYRDILYYLTSGKKLNITQKNEESIVNKLFDELAIRLNGLGFVDIKKKGKTGILFMPKEISYIPKKNARKLNGKGNFSSNDCDDRNISFDLVFTSSKRLYFRITLLKANFDSKELLSDTEKSNLIESQSFYKKIEGILNRSGLSLNKKSGGDFGYRHIEQQLLYKDFDIIIDSITEERFGELVHEIVEKIETIYNRESTKKIINVLQENKDYLLS